MIESVDAIPIDREGLGLAGLKETLRRLKRGELGAHFPRGYPHQGRRNGPAQARLQPVAQRANVPLLPVGIEGSFTAWPRWRPIPLPATIHIHFGLPILPDEAAQFSDRELVAEVERRIPAVSSRGQARGVGNECLFDPQVRTAKR